MNDTTRVAGATLDLGQRRVGRPVNAPDRASYFLPSELIVEASHRLGWLGLVYAGALIATYVGRRVLLASTEPVGSVIHFAYLLPTAMMGIAVYVVSRSGVLSPARLLDLGLVFEVAGAFGIAAGQLWVGDPRPSDASFTLIPGECVWIVAYPLVVPNTPRKVLAASILAATVGPAVLAIASAAGGTAVDASLLLGHYVLPNYLSAAIAYAAARIVYRFSLRLKDAREIGSYELVERLGQGGMGEVWRAKHRLLARPAAIKLIRTEVLGSSQRTRDAMVRRFEREAQDTAMLGSPHTIDVYDFGVDDEGDFYYVMELLEGISLESFVQIYGPMEPARAVYLLRQICHSLDEAHSRGLIHRDIKPANLFMCRLGLDDDFVKVLDFGLVKRVDRDRGTMLTAEGSTAGTPAYMAPEIALGRPDIDGRADIYSLACVAYFLLTGQPVFVADGAIATVLAHVNDEPIPLNMRSEFEIPSALEAIILQCLNKHPAQRPASVAELAQRLAVSIPQNAWTADAAHAWWELHGRFFIAGSGTTAEPDTLCPESTGRRFWPRLDRKPTPPPFVYDSIHHTIR